MTNIKKYLYESAEVIEKCVAFENEIEETTKLLTKTFVNGHKVLISGNGGSCADSQHIAGELVSKFKKNRRGLAALALPTSLPVLTAASNDYSYEDAMAREVDAFGQFGDVFWAISTSGNSKNLLKAIKIAQSRGMKIIGFTGESGGNMADKCDILFNVPHHDTPIVQQGHYTLAHLICEKVESLFPDRDYLPDVKETGIKKHLKTVLKKIKKTN